MTVIQARPSARSSALPAARHRARPLRERQYRPGVVLAALDGIGVTLVITSALLVSGGAAATLQAPALALAWLVALALTGEYRRLGPLNTRVRRLITIGCAMPTLVLLVADLVGEPLPAAPVVVVSLACVGAGAAGRALLDVADRRGLPLHGLSHRVILVGPAHALVPVQERLEQHRRRFRVTGSCVIDPDQSDLGDEAIAHCRATLRAHDADTVVLVPDPLWDPQRMRRLRWALEEDAVRLFAWTGLWRAPAGRTHLDLTQDLPLLHVSAPPRLGPARAVKEVFDRSVAAVALLLLAPLMLVVAVAVRLDSPGPALFRQQRVGRDSQTFSMWKFRTMHHDAEAQRAALEEANQGAGPLFKLRRDPRVTRIGQWLRRTSLDELPQLLNVVCGQMSLVGPRPALPAEVALYQRDMRRRLAVPPGITGLWQVSGRSDLSWAESVHLDLTYVDDWSLLLDLRILARTTAAVLRGRGAY